MAELARIGIVISEDLVEEFDRLIARRGHSNRSEAFRDLVRNELVNEISGSANAEVYGAITLIYDHYARLLPEKLTQLQREYYAAILSSVHVHLDHDNCLEVILVRGRSSLVKSLANALIATKGVKHSRFMVTTSGRNLPRHRGNLPSLEIRPERAHEIVCSTRLFIGSGSVARENVVSDVALDHFSHERIHSASACRNVVEDLGAIRRLLIQGPFDGRDLAHDPADPIQQLPLLLDGVRHIKQSFTRIIAEKTLQAYPSKYRLFIGDRIGRTHVQRERRPTLSDGGSNRLREQQTDTDSAEPPSLTDSCL